jgi:hypothetical protein
VPELLINNKPLEAVKPDAALRSLAGFGAGAFPSEGVQAGALAGSGVAGCALPHRPWAVSASAGSISARSGYQPISRTQFEHMALINPVATGGLGPHPVREPEPV